MTLKEPVLLLRSENVVTLVYMPFKRVLLSISISAAVTVGTYILYFNYYDRLLVVRPSSVSCSISAYLIGINPSFLDTLLIACYLLPFVSREQSVITGFLLVPHINSFFFTRV